MYVYAYHSCDLLLVPLSRLLPVLVQERPEALRTMHPSALPEEAVQAQGVDMEGLLREYVRVWWPKLKALFKNVVQQYEGEDRRILYIYINISRDTAYPGLVARTVRCLLCVPSCRRSPDLTAQSYECIVW